MIPSIIGERSMGTLEPAKNQSLFGADSTEGIIAVEPVGRNPMRLFLLRVPRRGAALGHQDQL